MCDSQYFSASLTDFETNEEIFVEWKYIYLIESYKEKRSMVAFESGKSIKKGGDCLAIKYKGDECKFAMGIYQNATLEKKQHSKLRVIYRLSPKASVTIPKESRVKDDVFPSVIKLIPSIKSVPYILMKQQLTQTTAKDAVDKFPSPSVTPEPTISNDVTPIDTSPTLMDFNDEMLRRPCDKSDKIQAKKARFDKIIKSTMKKAEQSQNPNTKTAIPFSVKYIFCLRKENNPKISLKAIHRQMQIEGFPVGKGSGINLWAQRGSAHYQKLIMEKGNGAKLSNLPVQIC